MQVHKGLRTSQASKEFFLELLRVRYSCRLFRLPSANHIVRQVTFHNTGPQQACYLPPWNVDAALGWSEGTHPC